MDIQAHTKLFDLLASYPELEEKIVEIAPPFKNLRNPVLRKTVARLATLEKVAQIGNLEVGVFINALRRKAGQPELSQNVKPDPEWQPGDPDWIREEPVQIVDGTEMLNRGEHPLNRINALIREVDPGKIILLKTNFKPVPLIDEMNKQHHEVFSKNLTDRPDQHLTFIRRKQ